MQPPPLFNSRTSHHPKGNPVPVSSHSPFPSPSSIWQPLIYLLSDPMNLPILELTCIYGIVQYVPLFVWLLSLGTMFLRFIHVYIFIPFHGWITFLCVDRSYLFIHSSVGGRLGCFYPLDLMNNCAVNICAQFLCEHMFPVLLEIYLGMILLGHMITPCLTRRNCQPVFYSSLHTLTFPLARVQGLHILDN